MTGLKTENRERRNPKRRGNGWGFAFHKLGSAISSPWMLLLHLFLMKDLAHHAPLHLDLFTLNNTIKNSSNQHYLQKVFFFFFKKSLVTSAAVHFFLLCDLQYHIPFKPFKPFKRWVSFITLFKNPLSALEYSWEQMRKEASLFVFSINLCVCSAWVTIYSLMLCLLF